MSIRIVVAHDSDLARLGMSRVLEQDHRFEVVGTVQGFLEVLDCLDRVAPDVILLDHLCHQHDLFTVIKRLKQLAPNANLIFLGTLSDGYLLRDLLRAGMGAYLYASDTLCDLLIPAIQSVMARRPYLSPTANAEYLLAMQATHPPVTLDANTRQVLGLLSRGHTVKQIAHNLTMSHRHVYWLRQKLRKRFGANTNEDLVVKAIAEGFARLPE